MVITGDGDPPPWVLCAVSGLCQREDPRTDDDSGVERGGGKESQRSESTR